MLHTARSRFFTTGLCLLAVLGSACDVFDVPYPDDDTNEEPQSDGGEDEGDDGGDAEACLPEHPCAGLEGPGHLEGFKCDLDIQWANEWALSCEEALEACEVHALDYPGHSYLCEWEGVQIFASELEEGACEDYGPALPPCEDEPPPPTCEDADPCAGTEGELGLYYGDLCAIDGGSILTADIGCQDALDNCILNDESNPEFGIFCEWDGREIYRNDLDAEVCVPEYGPPPSCEEPPPSCEDADPCADAEGQAGLYYFDMCGIDGGTGLTADIGCQDALDNCILNDESNPGLGIYCEWDGREIYRNDLDAEVCVPQYGEAPSCEDPEPPTCDLDDPCADADGFVGVGIAYVGCTDDAVEIFGAPEGELLTCEEALQACDDVVAANPGQSMLCQWNDVSLYLSEAVPGECDTFNPC